MRRGAAVALAVVLALAGVIGLMAFFTSRDDATIGEQPGVEAPGETSDVLRKGNVVIAYGDPAYATPLRALAQDLGSSADPALVEAGAAVILDEEAGLGGVQVTAYKRSLQVNAPDDPRLRSFVEYWLGRSGGGGG